jgi:signal transduction histidine kinase
MGIKYKDEQLNTSEAPVFSRTIIDCVTEQMKAVLIFDAQSDYRLERADSIAGLNIKSAMSVPLKGAHGLVGIMQANTLLPKHRFNRDDLKLFTAIAYQIGTALENSLLYDRLENEKSALDQANRKLKSAQEHILQNEKLAAVGQLTAGIVHDIKNPMTVIYGHAKIVSTLLETNGAEKVIDGVDILESLREIEGGVNHCNDIINNLLQFSKESPPDKAAADINAITRGTLEFLKHEFKKRSITLRADLDEALPPVLVDVNQIKQVLLNIIINALQAVENHGTISIMTFHIPAAKENYTAVRIRDNGPGMTEEIKRKIFDPFFTTKESSAMECGGSGLGLSMCYGIIQNHGGQIEVESEPGKGTEFTVMLPVSEKMNQCYTTTSTVTDIRTL